ncbi:hypothetical protein J6590_011807 [Homalodisca vitripennis]|nr:hypothetical protein J6590_011807 [Homalodisca vitripennis]
MLEEVQEDHNRNLKNLMKRLDKENMRLNKEKKIKLCKSDITFYGDILTEEGVKPDHSKIWYKKLKTTHEKRVVVNSEENRSCEVEDGENGAVYVRNERFMKPVFQNQLYQLKPD